MACKMRGCGKNHRGSLHFRLWEETTSPCVIDLFCTNMTWFIRNTTADDGLAMGATQDLLGTAFQFEDRGLSLDGYNIAAGSPSLPSNLHVHVHTVEHFKIVRWEVACAYKGPLHYHPLPNLITCILAGTELSRTVRPGKTGRTSVLLNGVPITEAYPYTGDRFKLVTPGGQPHGKASPIR